MAEIYQQEYSAVFAYCLSRTGNWHVAEDLTSATFEKALGLFPHEHPHALLLATARYQVLNYWRRESVRATYSFSDVFTLADEDRYPDLASDDPTERMIELCDTAMAAALLRATLAQCSPTELEMINLRYMRDLPAKEVGARLGYTVPQYNKRHNSLMHRLAARLAPGPEQPQPTCLICDGAIYGRGVCHYHYQQARDGRRIPMLPPKVQARPTECQECGAPHYSRGYCRTHYQEQRTIERRQQRRQTIGVWT